MKTLHSFLKSESGALAPTAAISLMALVLSVGAAVDYSRWTNARYDMAHARDGAVLAGAKVIAEGGTEAEAIAAATAQFEAGVLDRFDVSSDRIEFGLDEDGTAFTGTGNAYLPTTVL